jgi:hypothetical protein
MYTAIAALSDHLLPASKVERARSLGVQIAAPKRLFLPALSITSHDDSNTLSYENAEPVVIDANRDAPPANVFFFPALDEPDYTIVASAMDKATLPFTVVSHEHDFNGYAAYDGIQQLSCHVRITIDGTTFTSKANATEYLIWSEESETAYVAYRKAKDDGFSLSRIEVVDDVEFILEGAGVEPVILPGTVLVTSEDRDEPTAFVKRGESATDVTNEIMQAAWYVHDDDDEFDSYKESVTADLLHDVRRVLESPISARAKAVRDALLQNVGSLLDGGNGQIAIDSVEIQPSTHGARKIIVHFADGTVIET